VRCGVAKSGAINRPCQDLGDSSQAFPALRFAHLRRASSVPCSLQSPLRGCAVLKDAPVTIAHAQERGEGDGRGASKKRAGLKPAPTTVSQENRPCTSFLPLA